jgi:hypothetical protein
MAYQRSGRGSFLLRNHWWGGVCPRRPPPRVNNVALSAGTSETARLMKAKRTRRDFVVGTVRVTKTTSLRPLKANAAATHAATPHPFLVHALQLRSAKQRNAGNQRAAVRAP